MRANAHDSPFCGRSQGGFRPTGRGGGFPIAPATPSALPYRLYREQTQAGRGGSFSRRDHNQVTGNRVQLTGGIKSEEPYPPNASRSSGEGVWGRGASLREAASPPESPHPLPLREGARGRGFSQRSRLPRIPISPHLDFWGVFRDNRRDIRKGRNPFWPMRSSI